MNDGRDDGEPTVDGTVDGEDPPPREDGTLGAERPVDPRTAPGDEDRLSVLGADATAHGFHQVLGFELEAAGDGWARASVPHQPDYVNARTERAMHGGVTASTLDAVLGYAVFAGVLDDPDREIGPTMSLTVNYVSTASEPLVGVGEVVELGSRTAIAEGKLYGADSGKVVATASGVWRVFDATDGP